MLWVWESKVDSGELRTDPAQRDGGWARQDEDGIALTSWTSSMLRR